MVFDNKEEITRCVGVLQNTIMRGVAILPLLLHNSRDDNGCSKRFGRETHKCMYIPLRERLRLLD